MKRKAIILASAAIITVASIGGYAFAQGDKEVEFNNQDQTVIVEESAAPRRYNNHCVNSEEMIDLMNENGYGNMSNMMESIGREGMINMHNSMMGGNGFNRGRGMMGRFQ